MRKLVKRGYLALVLLFLYIPIIVLIFQSFNAGKSRAKWEGFSFHWYAELLKDQAIMKALYVTLSIALIAAVASTILGTLAAIGIHAMRKRPQSIMMTMTNLPMTMPDIVTGISLMILFTFSKIERGYMTMLLAHITFNTPYVILSVLPKLKQMNKHTYEAALDLGGIPIVCADACDSARDQPRCGDGMSAGLYPVAGRFCDQLLYYQPNGAKPVHTDLLQGAHRHRAYAERAERVDVSGTTGAAAHRQPPRQ